MRTKDKLRACAKDRGMTVSEYVRTGAAMLSYLSPETVARLQTDAVRLRTDLSRCLSLFDMSGNADFDPADRARIEEIRREVSGVIHAFRGLK